MTDEAQQDPISLAPDDKDWTWVLDEPCAECGFDAATVTRDDIPSRLLAATPRWHTALAAPGGGDRPSPGTWSVLEYACHPRDVHTVFTRWARLVQNRENPKFENWDQDKTALAGRYRAADPARVAAEIEAAGLPAAAASYGLTAQQWCRPGRRSNGSAFTMESLGLYYLHDVQHHLHDVGA